MKVELTGATLEVKNISQEELQEAISEMMVYSFREGLVLSIDGDTVVYIGKRKDNPLYTVTAYFEQP